MVIGFLWIRPKDGFIISTETPPFNQLLAGFKALNHNLGIIKRHAQMFWFQLNVFLKSKRVAACSNKNTSCRSGIWEGKLRREVSSSQAGKVLQDLSFEGCWYEATATAAAAAPVQCTNLATVRMPRKLVWSTLSRILPGYFEFPSIFSSFAKTPHIWANLESEISAFAYFWLTTSYLYDSPAKVQRSHFETAANGQAVIYLDRIVWGLMIPKFSSYFCI